MNTIKEATTFYSTDFSTIWYSIPNELRHEFYEEIKSLGVRFYTNKEVHEEDIGCFMSVDPDLTTGYISIKCWSELLNNAQVVGKEGNVLPVIQLDYAKLKSGENPVINISK
mgnify:FL=1